MSAIPNSEIRKMFDSAAGIAKSEADPHEMKQAFHKRLDDDMKELAFRTGRDHLQLWTELMGDPRFAEALNAFEMKVEELARNQSEAE